jgi:hypothetical protein
MTTTEIEDQSRFIQACQRAGAVWCNSSIRMPDGTVYARSETAALWILQHPTAVLQVEKAESVTYLQIQLLKLHTQILTNLLD